MRTLLRWLAGANWCKTGSDRHVILNPRIRSPGRSLIEFRGETPSLRLAGIIKAVGQLLVSPDWLRSLAQRDQVFGHTLKKEHRIEIVGKNRDPIFLGRVRGADRSVLWQSARCPSSAPDLKKQPQLRVEFGDAVREKNLR